MPLPIPSDEALAYSATLKNHLAATIAAEGGWIGFDRFMALALYAPAMGYYSGGAQKLGAAGDFVTAPEISPLFAEALARQAEQVMALSAPRILEVGAGSGRLAADLLNELAARGTLPERYEILELSGELRARQQATLAASAPDFADRVAWLDRLPDRFAGLVLANELLDAMPVHLVVWGSADNPASIFERGVAFNGGEFSWRDRPASGALLARAQALASENALPKGYTSEIGVLATEWTALWGERLQSGALLLIDYGFPRREYYHAQRSEGTLMCHYRHHAHADPFYLPGLQDITAHVDFTAIAEAGFDAGLDFLGYTSQATFLINCGLPELFARRAPEDGPAYWRESQAVQKLISPAEMGELFKVIALGKGIDAALLGFAQGDRGATL